MKTTIQRAIRLLKRAGPYLSAGVTDKILVQDISDFLNKVPEKTLQESKEQPDRRVKSAEETPILDIALDIVFLKYGNGCLQDAKFNTDLGEAYDFIQNMIKIK